VRMPTASEVESSGTGVEDRGPSLPDRDTHPGRKRRVIGIAIAAAVLISSSGQDGRASPIGGSGEIRYGVSKVKGFDTCSAPTVAQMQTWWNNTPYYDIGIYIGGAMRACSQPNLTSAWARSVHEQGWSFYLTWVGPQAPCTSFRVRFSSDPTTARQQGRDEADRAVSAARNLGFTGKNMYFYDMESYDTTNSACRRAVNAFVGGWVGRIHNQYGEKAGVYGSSCGSAVSDWADLQNVPDTVWVAAWNNDPDVWGLPCLSDSLWIGDQRLHQYRGSHAETWGGITLTIDNDCAKGLVTPHGHTVIHTECTTE
jgi:hypothetical protein